MWPCRLSKHLRVSFLYKNMVNLKIIFILGVFGLFIGMLATIILFPQSRPGTGTQFGIGAAMVFIGVYLAYDGIKRTKIKRGGELWNLWKLNSTNTQSWD
jgi:hypothetical protein